MERVEVPLPDDFWGIIVRRRSAEELEPVVLCRTAAHVLTSSGGGASSYALAPQLTFFDANSGQMTLLGNLITHPPVYDPFTNSTYYQNGANLCRIDSNDIQSFVAECWPATPSYRTTYQDGAGATVRSRGQSGPLASDGRGGVFMFDAGRGLRHVCVVAQRQSTALAANSADANSNASASTSSTAVIRPAGTVRTLLPASPPLERAYRALAYHSLTHELIAATATAIYRLWLPDDNSEPPGISMPPVLLAGQKGTAGACDGAGSAARFQHINGLTISPCERVAYVVDSNQLRRLDLVTAAVTTLAALTAEPSTALAQAALLPQQGCLAVGLQGINTLFILRGNEFKPGGAAAAAAVGAATGAAPASGGSGASPAPPAQVGLAAMLLQPTSLAGSLTVEIRFGDQVCAAHRAVLCHHSEYFRQCLQGNFAEGGAGAVELSDADPAAFAALLAYMYTGTLVVPDELVRSTAELAGRLLVRGASAELERRLLAAVTPATIVEDLIWAERHNLEGLAEGLKARLVWRRQQVATATPVEVLRRLAVESPALMAEIFKVGLGRP